MYINILQQREVKSRILNQYSSMISSKSFCINIRIISRKRSTPAKPHFAYFEQH
ncbi:hypothetical protein KSS87_013475 [Heliosperma pusillum]|nr:hypothetical protein KSS87_013475 [Heliosperma pusillum]